jgi:hypothetical protein
VLARTPIVNSLCCVDIRMVPVPIRQPRMLQYEPPLQSMVARKYKTLLNYSDRIDEKH